MIVILWGIAHINIPTQSIVAGFGAISTDNKRISLTEWLTEGVLLILIGVLVALVTIPPSEPEQSATIAYQLCASVLVVMAGISLFAGARRTILSMKLCPPIFLIAAVLFFVPIML
jgi:hypothetical protein